MDYRAAGAEVVMVLAILALWRLMVAAMVKAASFALVMCQ